MKIAMNMQRTGMWLAIVTLLATSNQNLAKAQSRGDAQVGNGHAALHATDLERLQNGTVRFDLNATHLILHY